MPERAKLRVLCLHSFRTSAAALAMQLRYAGLTGALEARCELVIRDAPHVLGEHEHEKVSAALRSFFNPPYCEWFNAETDASSGEVSYTRWAATLAYVARIWREEGPFDGYLGFSQGATVCHALAALHARGACPELAEFPAPRFALCFSGRRCRDSALAPTLYDEAALAELRATELEYFHAWNEGDTVVKAEESASMADTLGGGRHTTPSSSHAVARLDRAQLTALEAFLDSQRARAKDNNATAATWWDFMASYCSVS